MGREWNDSQPIYRQLRDRVVHMILEGALKEGDPLPSVRTVAAEYRVNPLTVLKGYQQLVDEGLVEARRGLGMFVTDGAGKRLLQGERQRFLKEEWPKIRATIQRLGRSYIAILAAAAAAPDVSIHRLRYEDAEDELADAESARRRSASSGQRLKHARPTVIESKKSGGAT